MNKPNFWQRFTGPTPPFWQAVRNFGATLTGMATSVLAVTAIPNFPTESFPQAVFTIAGYVLVGGAVLTAAAQSTYHPDPNGDEKQ